MIKATSGVTKETSASAEETTEAPAAKDASVSNESDKSAALANEAREEAQSLMGDTESAALIARIENTENALISHKKVIEHLCGRLGINPSTLLTE